MTQKDVFRMIDMTTLLSSHRKVVGELEQRGLVDICEHDNLVVIDNLSEEIRLDLSEKESEILKHVVGRNVALIGEPTELIFDLLTEDGYRVDLFLRSGSLDWVKQKKYRYHLIDREEKVVVDDHSYDTVLYVGNIVSDNLLDELERIYKWSLIVYDGEVDRGGYKQEGDLVYHYNFTIDAPVKRSHLVVRGKTLKRYKVNDDFWRYDVGLLNDDVLAYCISNEEYRNGTIILVDVDGIIETEEGYVGINPVVVQRSKYKLPHDLSSVISMASNLGLLYNRRNLLDLDVVLNDLGISNEYNYEIRKRLKGFVGSREQIVSRINELLPELIVEEDEQEVVPDNLELDWQVDQFVTDQNHRVYGIVLEPYKPYGNNGVWFSPETITNLAHRFLTENAQGALDHTNNDKVKVVESFVILPDMRIDGLECKPGTWILGCEVADDIYQEVIREKYKGFSIKGIGQLV